MTAFTAEDYRRLLARVESARKWAGDEAESLGFVRSNQLTGGVCEECGAKFGKPHEEVCPSLQAARASQTLNEVGRVLRHDADELTRLRTALEARERVIAGVREWMIDTSRFDRPVGSSWLGYRDAALAELARLTAELTGEPR